MFVCIFVGYICVKHYVYLLVGITDLVSFVLLTPVSIYIAQVLLHFALASIAGLDFLPPCIPLPVDLAGIAGLIRRWRGKVRRRMNVLIQVVLT